MPSDNTLYPPGHNRIDTAVRFTMKSTGYVDILSSYGTLRISLVSSQIVRVCFAKGQCSKFPELSAEIKKGPVKYKIRENPTAIEIMTEKLIVHVDKKTGAISFVDVKGKVLLAERAKEPRQISPDKTWEFFDFGKDANLIAKSIMGSGMLRLGMSAKYISFGKTSSQMPALSSTKGYELLFPAHIKTLCCSIPMYGPYVSFENTDLIDFYFKIK